MRESNEPKDKRAEDPSLAALRSRVEALEDQIGGVQRELEQVRSVPSVKTEEPAPKQPVARPERPKSPKRPRELHLKGDLFYYTAEQLLDEIGMSGKVSWRVQSQIADLLESYKQERTRLFAIYSARLDEVAQAMYARGDYVDEETYQRMLKERDPKALEAVALHKDIGGGEYVFLLRPGDHPELEKAFGDAVGLTPDVMDEIGRVLAEAEEGL